MDSSFALKQQFLSKEIMDKGYNTNEFLNFLKSKKVYGDNLDYWTMGELRQYVAEFQIISKSISMSEDKNFEHLNNSLSFRGTSNILMSIGELEPQVKCLYADRTDFSDLTNILITLSL